MVVGSLKPDGDVLADAGTWRALWPEHPSLQNYRDVFERVPFTRYMVNSLWIASCTVLVGLVVNAPAGYALARLRWRGRQPLLGAILMLMIVPVEAIAVPLFFEVTWLGWRDTYIAQIAPFVANPLAIIIFYTYFLGMPRELEESARIDGAGVLRTFVSVVAPNARPAFATVAILTFLAQWSTYLWPLLVTSGEHVRPLPLGIATLYTLPPLQWGDIFAFGAMMVAPVVVVFVVFQRWFVRSVVSTGIRG